MSAVWPGRVIGGVEPRDPAVSQVDLLAEVALDETRRVGDEKLLERLMRAASGHGGFTFGFGFLSNRMDRLVFLFRGADAETARSILAGIGFPQASAWSCTVVTPGPR